MVSRLSGLADWEINLQPGVSRDLNDRGESASDRESREPLYPFRVRTTRTSRLAFKDVESLLSVAVSQAATRLQVCCK